MISKAELLNWLNGLDDDAFIGVDEGGLALVVDDDGQYFEIGGIPADEDEE